MGIVVVAAFAANAAGASAGDDYRNLSASQFGRQRRQPIDLIFGPAVMDRYVLALDIAGLFQALAKCAQTVRQRVRGPAVKESDHRHRRLLRPAASGHAAAPPSAAMNSRRFIRLPRRRGPKRSLASPGPWRAPFSNWRRV